MDVADNIDLVRASVPESPAPAAVPPEAGSGSTDTPNSVTQSDTDSRSSPLRSSTVMMVDDDPIMLEVVQAYLEEAGYTSFVTTSEPRQAMDLFLERRPDILLLDLMMPEVSGFDILAQVRAHEELRYTPVIILTAESESTTKLKALELGATDLLTKPVDPSELRLRLRNALAFKAYQDRLADFDALTGLPNRRKFHQTVDAALKSTQQSRACALLHVDLDRFKQINDTLGHRVGDKLLCAVAQLLDRTLSDAEATGWPGSRQPEFRAALSRVSGNGFAALLPNLHNLKKVDTAGSIARRVLSAFAEPFHVEGQELFVTASIGIAVSPGDGQEAETLLKHAEMAMYQAKQRGRKACAFFSGDMNAHALERLTLENQLRRAVERNEFVLYYQPKVDVSSGHIIGAEALVRWRHPELGIVSPAKFIPIAEETGLIVEIGQWVLRAACAQIQAWMQRGLPPLSISVNVSGAQFKQRKVWHAVRGALAHSSLPPGQLVLELTESMLMENATDSIEMLNELKEMGLKLAVDDFGTGYSSLTYLSRFPLDELKIDRSFVSGLPGERHSLAIVGAIIALARELNLRVVAEGVETREQLQFLRARECDEYQGYLCSRPAPPEAFAILMRRQPSQRAIDIAPSA
jgi:diguanylate cyclase (GGDEF)-like protein